METVSLNNVQVSYLLMVQPYHEIISVGLQTDSKFDHSTFRIRIHESQAFHRQVRPLLILKLISQNFFGEAEENQEASQYNCLSARD
jgi:hypothetical protein